MKRIFMGLAFLLILAAGVFLRVPKLAERPMHHDEANQAYRFGILLEEGRYTYDADDHHGPTLYYLTFPVAKLSGTESFAESTESTYRLVPVFFGVLLILCTPLLWRGIGGTAVLAAALLTAVSSGMAYYSRFYIQETPFVFFTFMTMVCGWRSFRTGSIRWAAACGLFAGLMLATKETAVISFAAMLGAGMLCALKNRSVHFPVKTALVALITAAVISTVLFSSFFTNPEGPLESFLAFKNYLPRGAGVDTDHVHPWYFYLRMLIYYRFGDGPVWNEALIILLGLGALFMMLLKRIPRGYDHELVCFLGGYTLLLTLAYSFIPYKTPWCILSFLHGWILLAGIAAASVIGALWKRRKWLAVLFVLVILAASGELTRRTWQTVTRYAADVRNPYVYAQTVPDFMNLVRRVSDLETVSPKGNEMYLQIISDPKKTWPLPFYLRSYPNTGYWLDASAVPTKPAPDIIISPADFETDSDAYLTEYYGLRPDILFALHIRRPLWDAFLETRSEH